MKTPCASLHLATSANRGGTGDLYGRLVHPRRLPLTLEGTSMVAETRVQELQALGLERYALTDICVLECGGSGRGALGWNALGAGYVTHVDLSLENPANVRRYYAEHGIRNVESIQGFGTTLFTNAEPITPRSGNSVPNSSDCAGSGNDRVPGPL